MFNSIFADVLCPVKDQLCKKAEIQIKWQPLARRTLEVYKVGDVLEDIDSASELSNAVIVNSGS